MTWSWPISGLVRVDGADGDGRTAAYRIQIPNSSHINLCPTHLAAPHSFYECHYNEVFPPHRFSLDFDIATPLATLDARGAHDWYTLSIAVAFPSIFPGAMDPIDGIGANPGCKSLFGPGGPRASYCLDPAQGIDSAGDIVMDGSAFSFNRFSDGTALDNFADSTQIVGHTYWDIPYDPIGGGGDPVPCPDPMYPDTSNDSYVLLWQHDQLLAHTFTFRSGGTWTWTDFYSDGGDALLQVGIIAYDGSSSPTDVDWMCVL